jgi:hypothetical protein
MIHTGKGSINLTEARQRVPIHAFRDTKVVQNVFRDNRCLREICASARCVNGETSNASIMENHCGFWTCVTFNQSTNTFDFLIRDQFECNVIVDEDGDYDSCDCYDTLTQPADDVFDLQTELNKDLFS